MISSIREYVYNKLSEISDIEFKPSIVDDDLLENGVTYFFYSFEDEIIDLSNTHRLSLVGYVCMVKNAKSDTLNVVDTATNNVISKLKEINFHSSWADETFDDIVKIRIEATTYYNECNNGLI